ncbi:hypothetical protein NTGBS_1030029 [Candidatus Nitrotoga sp. BS]|nr:hypothetical protein NTGBS_1030029 [Candidatus Nitrotoga sp. BS]
MSYGYFLLFVATSSFHLLGKKTRINDYSYGVYIYAFPIQQTIVTLAPGISPVSLFLFSFPIVALFAIASWHFIEKPCLGLKGLFGLESAK